MPEIDARPLCVVLDTNQWDAHTMLRSHLAASLIYLLEHHDAKLGVPKVVENEITKHAHETLQKALTAASGALDRIRMVLGVAPDPEMPADTAAGGAAEQRLHELGPLIERVAIETRHHVAAGQMVLEGIAPNGPKDQQFKDCLLWQAVVDLGQKCKVLFVSSDNGFYCDKSREDVHPDLAPMAEHIRMVRTLEGAVSLLQETVPVLDLDPIFEAVDQELRSQVEALGSPSGLEVEGVNNASADTFVTGRPGETLIVFEMTHDLIGTGDELGRVITEGEALVRGGTVTDLRLGSMALEKYGDGGFGPAGRTVFPHAEVAVGGPRRREHQLRVPSPGPSTSRL